MLTARVTLEPVFGMGPVNRRLSGSLVEHLGRCACTGIDEPNQPNANERGVRTDIRRSVALRHTPATKENQ